ncbi:MAG: acyl carrier protein [Acidobacteriota bacterium]
MPDVETEILGEIRKIASRELEVTRPIEPGDELVSALDLDSVRALVLAVGLEDRFRVKLPDEETAGLVTVGDLVRMVASCMSRSSR